jgi:hypothetical protein
MTTSLGLQIHKKELINQIKPIDPKINNAIGILAKSNPLELSLSF